MMVLLIKLYLFIPISVTLQMLLSRLIKVKLHRIVKYVR